MESASTGLYIKGGCLVTMDPQRRVLGDGSVLTEDNQVVDVGPAAEVERRLRSVPTVTHRVIDASQCLILPGLVSSHTHLFQSLFRGLGDGLPMEDWCQAAVFPPSTVLGEEECYLGALLAIAEMIRSGTTCFADSHLQPVSKKQCFDGIARAVIDSGMRAVLARASMDQHGPAEFLDSVDSAVDETARCIETYEGGASGRLSVCPEAISAYECSPAHIRSLRELSLRYETGFHMHVAETLAEARLVRHQTGLSILV